MIKFKTPATSIYSTMHHKAGAHSNILKVQACVVFNPTLENILAVDMQVFKGKRANWKTIRPCISANW
jgi:hypothetical protein